MKRLLLLFCLTAVLQQSVIILPAFAQQTNRPPDCVLTFSLNATGNSNPLDNRGSVCTNWTLSYSATSGITALSVEFDGASDVTSSPGSFSIWPQNQFYSGGIPMTKSYGIATGYGFQPWLRVAVTINGGSGRVSGVLAGYRVIPGVDAVTGNTVIGGTLTSNYTTSSIRTIPLMLLKLPCNALRTTNCQ